ncbi:MAG: hypothetical protein R3D68_12620 [Hyphomicrobiaceae bacterium]
MSMTSQGVVFADERRAPEIPDQPFFTKLAIALALFIIVGFVQWSLRGFVSIGATPWWVHAHGLFMVLWLAIFVAQNVLAGRGNFQLHRRLGWMAMIVVAGTGVFGSLAGIQALALHRIPPFFTNAYFLALTQVEIGLFVATVAWAVACRRQTQWHRRLMVGATVLLMEPALGRLLPMPLLGGMGEWLVLAFQLVPLAILARHDRANGAAVHPATLSAAAIVIGSHVLVTVLAGLPAFAEIANRIAGQ